MDLQLAYVFIEHSYNELRNFELHMGNGFEICFLRKEFNKEKFEWMYCFSFERCDTRSLTGFFDTNNKLKRIDALVGINGTGKTTILNALAEYRKVSQLVEIYYSADYGKYYYYASKNNYIDINSKDITKITVLLNGEDIEEINKQSRRAFLHPINYLPDFIWSDKVGYHSKMIMKNNYSLIWSTLNDSTFIKRTVTNPNSFSFEFTLCAAHEDIANAIDSKKKVIECLNNGHQTEAITNFSDRFNQSLKLLSEMAKDRPGVTKEETIIGIEKFRNSFDRFISTLHILIKNNVKLGTDMDYDSSYDYVMVSEHPKLDELTYSFKLYLPIDQNNVDKLDGFFRSIDELKSAYMERGIRLTSFDCGFDDMSTGEMAYLEIYTEIYHTLLKNSSEDGIVLLLLDEPETYMHPEWSRQMINRITDIIVDLYNENKGWKSTCQVILSTHTPYLLSDLLPGYIHLFHNESEGISITKPSATFAANLYDLLNSSFFVENPIGMFAMKKLETITSGAAEDLSEDDKMIIKYVGDDYLKRLLMAKLGMK